MNYDIEIDEKGRGRLTWNKKSSNLVNVYLSVKTPKGFLTTDPEFGLDISDIKKVTENTIDTLKQRFEKALEWMISARKARSVDVEVSLLQNRSDGVKIKVTIVELSGVKMQFVDFVQVGGAQWL